MGTEKRRWLRWALPIALGLLAAWMISNRQTRPSTGPLPSARLAKGPPAFRQPKTDLNLSPQLMQSMWPAGHRDSGNTDYVPTSLRSEYELHAHLLRGHPIFWPPTIGVDGISYVVTGSPPGESHLFALSPEGEVLWSAPPQESLADLDSFAIMNAPTIDDAGDLYVGDRNQLWAFRPNGEVKWVVDLEPYGVDWGFMTVMLSRQNYVGGVTTNGKVLFFTSHDGELAAPPLDLPGGAGPPAEDEPPDGLWKGLMDPTLIPFLFNLIQGWELEVANTPALHPETGRLYITAAGKSPDTGVLYGIDITDDTLSIAFEAPMGGGSGTSPAISQDGNSVYAVDEWGRMISIDAHTGRRNWQSEQGGGGSASPSVGADETIYTPFQDRITAYAQDGAVRWQRSYDDLCQARLPKAAGVWGLLLSAPVAFIDSILTVGPKSGWMNVVCGYHLPKILSRSERTRVPIPRESLFVTFDLSDGAVVGEPVLLPETSEGFVTPLTNGNAAVTTSGAISSIFYYMVNRILPEDLHVAGPPEAGLLILKRR
ncbi:MAG: PQQ-binding-like beta-propeller repeat protein [Polyangiales bacterium]